METMQALDNANVSAFLCKLWKMVNDPSTDRLIGWNQTGNTFIIHNQAQFWYELLPLYYKHNNMSSFVRQLNMYGFHKISSLENSTMFGSDKDESQIIQFYHPCFQKNKPEKLSSIKRKVQGTASKPQEVQGSSVRRDDLTKVLTDVKQLRGRQTSVDCQLSAMKQENSVLWRELAMLRQKHMKQQQIVNKLIQFLVTLVQPAASSRMGVGVKRRMPLMLFENPSKKTKSRKNSRQHNDAGPTIHELESEVDLYCPEQLLEDAAIVEEDLPLEAAVAKIRKTSKVESPITPSTQLPQDSISVTSPHQPDQQQPLGTDPSFWDKPEFVDIEDVNEVSDSEEDLMNTLEKNAGTAEKVFINPNNRDTLIGSLANSGTYSANISEGKNSKKQLTNKKKSISEPQPQTNMQIATKNPPVKISSGTPRTNDCFRDELDLHLDSTETELDQLKDILNGCNTFDANALLGLFTENDPGYGVKGTAQNKENPIEEGADPLVSENEVTTATNLIDFNELFDNDLTSEETNLPGNSVSLSNADLLAESTGLDTPLIIKNEPTFPSNT